VQVSGILDNLYFILHFIRLSFVVCSPPAGPACGPDGVSCCGNQGIKPLHSLADYGLAVVTVNDTIEPFRDLPAQLSELQLGHITAPVTVAIPHLDRFTLSVQFQVVATVSKTSAPIH